MKGVVYELLSMPCIYIYHICLERSSSGWLKELSQYVPFRKAEFLVFQIKGA